MSSKVIIDDGFSFSDSLERAKTHSAYYEEDLFVTVAERLISAMEKQGVSRSELARKMGVSPAYITKILRGHANLGLETLAKLAFALELKWECLLIQLSETGSKDIAMKPKTSKPSTKKIAESSSGRK